MRENPTSRYMKPSCMSITRTAATSTQVVSTATVRSLTCCFKGGPFARFGARRPGPATGRAPVCAWPRTPSFAPRTGFPRRVCTRGGGGLLADWSHARAGGVGQAARVHAEEAAGIAGSRPDTLVAEQVLVEDHGQPVANRGHAPNREARCGTHLVGPGLANLGAVERVGELVRVDPVLPRSDANDRVAVAHEHDRLGDLVLVAAHGAGGVPDR